MGEQGASTVRRAVRLLVYLPGEAPWSFELTSARTLVGRGDHCDLRLEDETVSWDHVELARAGDTIVVTDLGSRNGTLLNGRPLSGSMPLHGGEVLTLGSVRLELTLQPATGRRPTAVSTTRPIRLSDEQREIAQALAAPFRAPGAVAARPPTRAELAQRLHLSERTVQRRMDTLAKQLGLGEHRGHDRPLLLARRIIELGLDGQR